MEENMSLTHSSSGHFSIMYDKYFMMLQNACMRYDRTCKLKPSTTSRALYQHELDEDPSVHDEENDYLDDNFAPDGIDTSFPGHLLENQNPTRLYLPNLGIMDLSTSPSIFKTCLVKMSRRS